MASVADTPEAQAFHFYNWLSVCASADMPLHIQQGITEAIRGIKSTGAFAAVASVVLHS
jgi:hypothetical protein